MRAITPSLTPELDRHCHGLPVWRARPFPIPSFRALVEHVARLAYANRDELLFFRGQDQDYQSKAGGSTLYPSIYRGDALASRELRHRFAMLEQAARLLAAKFKSSSIEGYRELRYKRYIQWSILQHYEVVETPLLDVTQSIRVACSIAQMRSTDARCYVYVLGLPYLTNRISINSEHDLVNVRLLSICPPNALRPYFQEGYLAGTTDVTTEFDSKTELDFRNRLIAKFEISSSQGFWGTVFERIPELALYPKSDPVLELCSSLKEELKRELSEGDLGSFIEEWASLESFVLEKARRATSRNVSVREAIGSLAKEGILSAEDALRVEQLRRFRNSVVHEPGTVEPRALQEWFRLAQDLRKAIVKQAH